MASGLLNPKNPKKSRESIAHEPKQPPWKTKPQAQRTAIEDHHHRSSGDSSGRSFAGEGNNLRGYSVSENRVRIALKSCSRMDIRELRRRLTTELDQVRRLVKKLEALSAGGGVAQFQTQFSSNSKKKKTTKQANPKEKISAPVYKSCSALLEKLMKHKFGWVFNAPVDAKALGLLDYHVIVKRPMDLGTVKSQLSRYGSALEFSEDVRLTFRNALLYNPKGQDVHSMAETMLSFFEEKWAVIESSHGLVAPVAVELEKEPEEKRDMTYEEKQRLSTRLQNLPSEKLDNVVQIIKKRNLGLCQQEDEIEVDIASVDAETLWELDRFVTSYLKGLSKNKRKAEAGVQSIAVENNVARKCSKTESDSEGSLASGYRS